MTDLDSLLERSRSPGSFVERRRFTLSRDKAIEKIREFSLRSPSQYILELVQAAVFAGAQHIAIDTTPEHMLIAFIGGRPIHEPELDRLFDYLFADRTDPATRHLVQLAVGVNAILQRSSKGLRLESGDGTLERSVRLDLDRKGRGSIGKPARPLCGTYLVMDHPGAWRNRFAGRTVTAEQGLIEERCLYTPVPILLNTEAPFGYRPSRAISLFGVPDEESFDDGVRRGVLAISARGAVRPGIRLVVGGVWIVTHPVPELGRAPTPGSPDGGRLVMGVVCDDALRKTADQSDIVRDSRWHQLLHAVQPHATRLIRREAGPRYAPPTLAPVPPEEGHAVLGSGEPEPEPLPKSLAVIGPSGPLLLDQLGRLAPKEPLFWVQPDDLPLVEDRADPATFSPRVLILRPGQALTLAEELPEVALHRLTTAADVDFVRNAMARHERRITRSAPAMANGVSGELTLRFQVAGRVPAWDVPASHRTPFCILGPLRAVHVGGLPLDLPGVSACFRPDHDDVDPAHWQNRATLGALEDAIELEAWRLLEAPGDDDVQRSRAPLLHAMLRRYARPFLVRDADGLAGQAALPPRWRSAGPRLMRQALVDDTEGPIGLVDLAALGGTERTRRPAQTALRGALEPLELRFCPGHLLWSDLDAALVTGVGLVGRRWVRLTPQTFRQPALSAVLAVGAHARPDLGEGWTVLDSGIRGVVAAHRRAPPSGGTWGAAEHALYALLLELELGNDWAAAATGPVSGERARTLGRLALTRVSVRTGRAGTAPVYRATDGDHRLALEAWRQAPAFRVVAREGATVHEGATICLGIDEAVALEEATGPLPLRFDDPPQIWTHEPARDGTGWLVRQEVQLPGVSGWLGLRHPYDPTAAVLVEAGSTLRALGSLEREVPCHGLLTLEDPDHELSDAELAMIRLSGLQLYHRLVGLLEGDGPGLDEGRREAAWRHGASWVLLDRARRGPTEGAVARLARALDVPGPGGRTWGTLERWLQLPAEHRPRLPHGLELRPSRTAEVRTRPAEELPVLSLQEELEAVLAQLGSRLQVLVLGESDPGADLVRIDEDSSHGGLVVLVLNATWPGYAAAMGSATGRAIALREMARIVVEHTRAMGQDLDLLTLHRALLARGLRSRP